MSKIICDVCGTSYPETATHCPICGCVRAGDAQAVSGDTGEHENQNNNYTYVKGGRFSKSNVKKRGTQAVSGDGAEQLANSGSNGKGKDTGIVIAIIALLLAIVAVVIYIVLRFFAPAGSNGGDALANTTTVPTTTTETIETTVLEIPCQNITVSKATVEFEKADAALLLNVTTDPADTTDVVVFASTDERVATVNQDGKVTAVGPGEAVITITCGQAAAECHVVCNFEVAPSEGETEPSTEATEPETAENWDMNWSQYMVGNPEVGDVSVNMGEVWTVYLDKEGKVKSTQIKFSSSNESVITVNRVGVATVTGKTGDEAYIYAEYNGKTVKCRVMVR